MFLCCLGPGITNRVSRTVRGLIAIHPTILAKAEEVNALNLNFSSNVLKGIKYKVFPIELLIIAGVNPFQNPLKPCYLVTILEYTFIFSQISPLIFGERIIAILKTYNG